MILFLRAILALYQKFNILRLRKKIKCVPAFWKQNSYITGNDISKPLKNSFIHTGHGDPGGKSWGDPGAIDE